MRCAICGAELAASAKFCVACGAAVSQSDLATLVGPAGVPANEPPAEDLSGETVVAKTFSGETVVEETYIGETFVTDQAAPATPPKRASTPVKLSNPRTARPISSSSSLTSSDPLGGARFAPGQIIAERYRVVALAGRGGMGEVYRAEDLRLGQVVAIKFLPEALSNDAAALARFHSEVRIARQVSHVNVCRVFDIGEINGISFLTMEYVDGEDLASVVRRIGRLSSDKASEIMRQMCAGLAAAHDRGVIHRDLKPANVMLDSAGKIRITDFGLAGLAVSMQGAEIRAGTPAYMAPEQLAGLEVTPRSDIYSLGLIFYEILTGKRAFEATTLAELMKVREEGRITHPSELIRELDPLIERVILRCLDHDPAKRPRSALQVAAALPGGDPLAAALAAGETPSPEMVAAAGSSEGLRPRIALILLALVLLGMTAYSFASDATKLNNLAPLDNPPEVLLAKAHDIVRQLGFTEPAADSAYNFDVRDGYISYIQKQDKTLNRWKALRDGNPAAIVFWYRQSPRNLKTRWYFSSGGAGMVTKFDPPMNVSGMIYLEIDGSGRLLHFERVPPQKDERAADFSATANWAALFSAAGLNMAEFHAASPQWVPPYYVDSRAAWTGAVPGKPAISERIEAAQYHGQPVYFDAVHPWDTATRDQPYVQSTHERLSEIILLSLLVLIVAASIYFGRQSAKQNRGDAKGAARIAWFVQLLFMAMWLLRAHHLASPDEVDIFLIGISWSFMLSSLARAIYFALEPFVRRNDPHTLISWSRLIAGQFKDPLVGRDLLIGAAYGVLLSVYETSDNLLPLFGKLPPAPSPIAVDTLLGIRPAIGLVFQYTVIFVLYALLIFFLLFLVRLAVRKDWLAALIIVFLGAVTNTGGDYLWVTFVASAGIWLSIYFILRKFGVLALVTGLVVQNILAVYPVTTHLSRWYASGAIAGMAAILALAIYGFRIALAGQSLFGGEFLEK